MTHEIELEGYYPKILGSPMRMLCLGTKASYGMEALHFQRGTGWDGLALDVTFTPDPQAEGTTVLADAGDTVAARRHSAGNQQRQRYGARRAGWRAVHQLQHPIPGAEPRPGARPADRPGGKCVETVCR